MTTTIPTDIRKEFENKIRRGIFRPVSRFLPEEQREERLQDAIAQTWEMYQNRASRGENLQSIPSRVESSVFPRRSAATSHASPSSEVSTVKPYQRRSAW